jgi:hypothetical protein
MKSKKTLRSGVYPRGDGKFGSRPTGGSARDIVHGPEALDEWPARTQGQFNVMKTTRFRYRGE